MQWILSFLKPLTEAGTRDEHGPKIFGPARPAANFSLACSPAITAHSNRGCSKLCKQCTSTNLYKLSAGGDWKVVMDFTKILACLDKQLYGPCLYCVLAKLFKSAGRQTTAHPARGPRWAGLAAPDPCSSLAGTYSSLAVSTDYRDSITSPVSTYSQVM